MARNTFTVYRPPALHIALAGGVTGGHLLPGLALADAARTKWGDVRISVVGCGRAWEKEQVVRSGHNYIALPAAPWPRGWRQIRPSVMTNLAGWRAARRWLKKHSPDIVVGLGGFASLPLGLAAILSRTPLLLMEQNVTPGRATRWLARGAQHACVAFEESLHRLPARLSIDVTGIPLRPEFESPPVEWSSREPLLVILGGSQGAGWLNWHAPAALAGLKPAIQGWRIVHLTGAADAGSTIERYAACRVAAHVKAYVDDMPALLRHARLAICRAGGTTLAELAAAGTPAVLAPLPTAAEDHQRLNAQWFAERGAARVLPSQETGPRGVAVLREAVAELLNAPDALWMRHQNMLGCGRRDASAAVLAAMARYLPVEQTHAAEKLMNPNVQPTTRQAA